MKKKKAKIEYQNFQQPDNKTWQLTEADSWHKLLLKFRQLHYQEKIKFI